MPRDPEKGRRPPAEGADANHCDLAIVVDPGDGVTAVDRWSARTRWGVDALGLCAWCMANPVDPQLGSSCAACREIGSDSVKSPEATP